jgi:ketosteroid isomerase-like protein
MVPAMNANEQLITRFYEAFSRRDAATMASCYAPDARFSDPVFPSLQGSEIIDMWTMLTGALRESSITFSDVRADDKGGSAHWEARYLYSATGRRVHNIIEARFTFADGRFATHRDQFDLWRWSRQALGPVGLLLGWSPIVRNKVQATAAQRLADYRAKQQRA